MGFDTGYYDDQKEMLAPHLSELFMNVATSGDMTAAMKEAVITVLHKGKGKDEEEVTSYRPVSITHAHYRIMTKAIGIKLQAAVAAVIGESQVAYMSDGRQMRDTTLSTAEAVRRAERKGAEGGIAFQVDVVGVRSSKMPSWDFIHIVLEEMGFPEEFRSLMKTLYSCIRI